MLRPRLFFILVFLIILAGLKQTARGHAAHGNGTNLAQLRHGLVSVILLYHLGVVLGVLDFDVLVQGTLGSVALGAVVDRALVVSSNFGRCSSVSLLLLVVDLKWHPKHLLMLPLVRLIDR